MGKINYDTNKYGSMGIKNLEPKNEMRRNPLNEYE